MQATKRTFFKRTAAACAATAVLIGGTWAGAAAAAPQQQLTPPSSATSNPPAAAAGAVLPAGLGSAIERDLGISVSEFKAQGALGTQAAELQAQLAKDDPAALVSLDGDTVKVQTTATEAAKTAAGSANVVVTSVPKELSSGKEAATSLDSLFADYIAEVGAEKLQSIMVDANGDFVIRTGTASAPAMAANPRSAAAGTPSAEVEFVDQYRNVALETATGPAVAFASDVVNGQGYVTGADGRLYACSIGWNGFDANGNPAVISAGHCTADGVAEETILTDPFMDPANNGPMISFTEYLGTFGISQFGGPANSPRIVPTGWDGSADSLKNIGTDVSVIDQINPELTQLAKVTDWTTPSSPKEAGPVVTGVSEAIVGTPICKSGRTTGWSCGRVTGVGVFSVGGKNYPGDPQDIRAVRGFSSTSLTAKPGDSGGPIIAGTLGVGMVSAGVEGAITYGVSLPDALKHIPGYTVQIFLNIPLITTTAPVYRRDRLSGTLADAPIGTTVAVTFEKMNAKAKVTETGEARERNVATVGVDGLWSVEVPQKSGTYSVTAQAENSYSTSESAQSTIVVIKEKLAAPAFVVPAESSIVPSPVTTIKGTGAAGAEVVLSGDATGTARVAADGSWSAAVKTALKGGSYTVSAKQTLSDWYDSAATSTTFSVVPAAPAATTPSDGQRFAFNEGPTVVSGSNVAGATVSVTVAGEQYEATVNGSTWRLAFARKFAAGTHAVSATQSVDGLNSGIARWTFSVDEPPTVPKLTPVSTVNVAASHSELAATGASSSLVLLVGTGGLLLFGGAVLLLIRRRSTK